MAAVNDIVKKLQSDSTYVAGHVSSVAGAAATDLIVVRKLFTIATDGTVRRVGDADAGANPVTDLASNWTKIA